MFQPAPRPRLQRLPAGPPAPTAGALVERAAALGPAGGDRRPLRRATDCRPALDLREWGVVAQRLGGLAGVRNISALWVELLDPGRDGEHLPGVDPEGLARKLRRLVPAEQVAVLEVADQVAARGGSLRERLHAAGVEGWRR